jgi:protein-disulfide isomerase
MIRPINQFSRRSILQSVSMIVAACPMPVQALSLSADDGSPIRSLALPAHKLMSDISNGFRFGSVQPDVICAELFDYNCGYCRHAHPGLQSCVNSNKNMALDLIHFPILSTDSEKSAALHHAVFLRDGLKVALEFHNALMSFRGHVSDERARSVCAALNIEVPSERDLKRAQDIIIMGRDKAKRLGIRFTPTFAIADASFVGWPGESTFKHIIAQSRLCGHVQCA